MNIRKTIVTATVFLTMAAMVAPAGVAKADILSDLQAQVQALLAQIATLQGTSMSYTFSMNLTVGSSGADVTALQNWLIGKGYSIPAGATGYFGMQTKAAVAAFQAANGISPAVGYFGPITRAKVNSMVTPGVPGTPTSPVGLTGGAGDITVASLSTYSSTNVGEGSNNVKVVAFTVEADSSSDVAITSMKVQAYQRTAADSRDMDDYMKEVTLWMEGTQIGTANVSEFSDASTTNLWEKSVSTSNAVIKKGVKNTFYIAVSSNNSIDTGDSDSDDWQISISSIRFLDGAGVTTTQAQTTDVTTDALTGVEQTFNFATSLTANSVELKVALKDEDKTINKAHLVNAKSGTSDNDDVAVLSFTMEAKGSDVKVEEFPVILTSSGDTTESNLIKTAHLYRGSTKLGSETVADGGAVTFDDLDFTVVKDTKDSFQVRIDVQDLTGNLDEGDEIKAEMAANILDGAVIAKDNTGEKLTSSEISGSALGEFVVFRDVGFTLTLVSTSAVISHAGDVSNSSDHDQGTLKIVFDVTAWDGDIHIDETAPDASGGATESDLDFTGSPTLTTSSIVCNTGCTDGSNALKVAQGETERFTITALATAASDALVDMVLTDLMWDTSDQDATLNFTYNLGDFKTPQVFLNLDQS